MATRDGKEAKYELIDYDGHNAKYRGQKVRLYEDGAIRNSSGHLIERHPDSFSITSENAGILRARNMELKRLAAQRAANDAVQRGDLRANYGDLAFVAELVDAAQTKATNIDDPKAIDAARFVLQVTGYEDKGPVLEDNAGVVLSNTVASQLLELIRQQVEGKVVDVE